MTYERFTAEIDSVSFDDKFTKEDFKSSHYKLAVRAVVKEREITSHLRQVHCLNQTDLGTSSFPVFQRSNQPIIELSANPNEQPSICNGCPFWENGNCSIITHARARLKS